MEEFRPFADRLALSLVNRAQVDADDFDMREGGAVALREEARKTVVTAFQVRKQEELMHPLLAEPLVLGLVPLVQARLMARFVHGDVDAYIPFTTK
jgi:CRISPR-associated protein Cas1